MSHRIGEIAPDFSAETTHGPLQFHDWLGDSWGILFSHPKDFTPVCTTELGMVAALKPDVDRRNVKVIEPDKKIRLVLVYPMTTGRNFDEILRVIDSVQLTARHKVATPANWTLGDDVIITPAVSTEDADRLFPGYVTHKPYLRTTTQPG